MEELQQPPPVQLCDDRRSSDAARNRLDEETRRSAVDVGKHEITSFSATIAPAGHEGIGGCAETGAAIYDSPGAIELAQGAFTVITALPSSPYPTSS